MTEDAKRPNGAPETAPEGKTSRSALRILWLYPLLGVLWIVLGDRLAVTVSRDIQQLAYYELWKGLLFIAVTTLLLYWLIRSRYARDVRLAGEVIRAGAEARIANLEGFPKVSVHPVMQIGRGGKVLYANEASSPLLHHWGRREGEILPDEWRRLTEEALDAGAPRTAEVSDGHRTYSLTIIPLTDADRVNIYGFDVSATIQMQDHLHASEARFRALLQTASDAVISAGGDGRITVWNKAAERIFGYGEDEALGKPLSLIMPERYREAHQKGLRRLHEGGEPRLIGKTVELHGLRKDGSEFPLELSLAQWESGGQPFYTAILRDTTERKRVEAELQKTHAALEEEIRLRTAELHASQRSYEALVQSLDGIVWEADAPSWRFTFVSRQAERILGYHVSEWLSDPEFWNKHLHPEDKDRVKAVCHKGVEEKRDHEVDYRFIAADGRAVWLRDKVSVTVENGRAVKLRGLMVDISEDKRREENARAMQEALLSLSTRSITSPDLALALKPITETAACTLNVERVSVWFFRDRRTRIECVQLYELSKGAHGESGASLEAGKYPAYFRAVWDNLVIPAHDAERDPRTREFTESYLRPLGITSMLDAPIRTGGEITGIVCHEHVGPPRQWTPEEMEFASSIADMASLAIEECHLLEIRAQLAEHQRKMDTLIANLPGIAYRCRNDRDWTMEFISSGCLPITGYTPADFIENRTIRFNALIHPEDRDQVWSDVQKALDESRPFQITYRIITASGEEKWVWEQGTGIYNSNGQLQALEGFIADITERKRAESALQATQEQLATVIATAPVVLFAVNREGIVTLSEGKALQALGRKGGESVGKSVYEMYADVPQVGRNIRRALAGEEFTDVLDVRGTIMEVWYRPVRDALGQISGVAGLATDITASRKAEADLRASEQKFRDMMENVRLIAVLLDNKGRVVFCNDYLLQISGYRREELMGQDWFEKMLPPAEREEVRRRFHESVSYGAIAPHHENPILTRRGEQRLISWNNTLLHDSAGNVTGTASIGEDITRRKELEQMLEASYAQVLHWSQHDALTGLVNQYHFQKLLSETLIESRNRGRRFALLYMDFDHFKAINDRYGHLAGDRYLRHISGIIQNFAGEQCTVARVGGDELAILIPGAGAAEAENFCESLLMELKRAPLHLPDEHLMVSVSIGAALFPGHGDSATEILSRAETAMREVKDAGGGAWKLSGAPGAPPVSAAAMEKDAFLARALGEGRLLAAYQPIRSLATSRDDWWEALARLRGPDGEVLEPVDFLYQAPIQTQASAVDIAIVSLGLEKMNLLKAHPQYRDLALSFNISPASLQDPEFFGLITARMDAWDVSPGRVIFEISENALLGDIHAVLPVINALHRTGIRFAIDDFGAGATSLRYLLNLPLAFLKIDSSYIRPLPRDIRTRALVEGILRIARQLNVAVVAEGVENAECYEAVRGMGVDYVQGYHLQMPALEPFREAAGS